MISRPRAKCITVAEATRRRTTPVAHFRLMPTIFSLITQPKCFGLVVVQSALQPRGFWRGHVAEWSSEGGAEVGLVSGAGYKDEEPQAFHLAGSSTPFSWNVKRLQSLDYCMMNRSNCYRTNSFQGNLLPCKLFLKAKGHLVNYVMRMF